jgi:hypothetical protein
MAYYESGMEASKGKKTEGGEYSLRSGKTIKKDTQTDFIAIDMPESPTTSDKTASSSDTGTQTSAMGKKMLVNNKYHLWFSSVVTVILLVFALVNLSIPQSNKEMTLVWTAIVAAVAGSVKNIPIKKTKILPGSFL